MCKRSQKIWAYVLILSLTSCVTFNKFLHYSKLHFSKHHVSFPANVAGTWSTGLPIESPTWYAFSWISQQNCDTKICLTNGSWLGPHGVLGWEVFGKCLGLHWLSQWQLWVLWAFNRQGIGILIVPQYAVHEVVLHNGELFCPKHQWHPHWAMLGSRAKREGSLAQSH